MLGKIILLFFITLNVQAYTVLLDPGHGGEDIGAVGKLPGKKKVKVIYEKDLTLAITKKIYKYLNGAYSVYMTRTIDRTIPLLERASLADKMQADLFVSVHINSSKNHKARGMEVYYLDNHKDKAVEKVEQLENFSDKSQKFDPVQHILTDLVIEKTVETSKKLGRIVNSELAKVHKRYHLKDRGIKPGLFYVLLLAKRPGLLVEVGFISNAKELRLMLNPKFQDRVAAAIARGIKRYIKQVVGVKEILF
jgi:N-acetylmuramoyl-L-alanine amidase